MQILILIGFTAVNILLLGCSLLAAGLSIKVYTEIAKERAQQIRAALVAAGVNPDADKAPPRDKIS